MEKRKKIMLTYIFIISIINLFISSYIEINKIKPKDSCFISGSCTIVDVSSFSDIAGIHLSIIGIFAFLILALLSATQIKNPSNLKNKVIFLLLIIISIFSLYLLFLQFFVIKAICKYCLVVDLLSISMLIAFIADIVANKLS
ncbi:MAG: vitamin K epoxide reductase family protein [Candidatus Pacearchaeota archaeon]